MESDGCPKSAISCYRLIELDRMDAYDFSISIKSARRVESAGE